MDYDVVNNYHGDFKRCFLEHNRADKCCVFTHQIRNFSSTEVGQRQSSEHFNICGCPFRLLVFPMGTPHAPEHSGKALSAYLQVADIDILFSID